MKRNVFAYDPFLGCPFDDSKMVRVDRWKGFALRNVVEFRGLNEVGTTNRPWIRGKIIAIGRNAKFLNGDRFTAFAVRVGDTVHIKTHREIFRVV